MLTKIDKIKINNDFIELILFFEDCTWTVHALYMLYLSQMKFMQVLIFGGLGGYLLLCHLPSRFERLLHKMRKDKYLNRQRYMYIYIYIYILYVIKK